MQSFQIQTSDVCGICMDESNRDFLYKTCCTFLICRKCYNQLEVECFPSHSNCPGCRQSFHKVGYSVDVVNNVVVPRAYCGLPLPDVKCLKEHDAHVMGCVECLKKIIRGNSWFEKQLTEKFAGIKRKLQSTEDEVFVRNQRIHELTRQNTFLLRELARQGAILDQVAEGTRARPGVVTGAAIARRQLFREVGHEDSVSSTDVFSSQEENSDPSGQDGSSTTSAAEIVDYTTPPRSTRSSAARTVPRRRRRPGRPEETPTNNRSPLQIALDINTPL